MDPEQLVASWLNRLTMVEWDRGAGDCVYGWIPRSDGHRDFIGVWFDGGEPLTFVTSSAAFSDEIHSTLFGQDSDLPHFPCVPVTELYPAVRRVAAWQGTVTRNAS